MPITIQVFLLTHLPGDVIIYHSSEKTKNEKSENYWFHYHFYFIFLFGNNFQMIRYNIIFEHQPVDNNKK